MIENNISNGSNAYCNFYIERNPADSSFKADIQIVGPLTGAKIGVSSIFDPTLEQESKLYIIHTDGTYSITESDFEVFDSDDDAYHILRSEDQLYLQPHSYNEWDSNGDGHWKACECGAKTAVEDHQWDEGTIIREASCDKAGLIEYVCDICGYSYVQSLGLKSHTIQYYQGIDSTCTKDGNVAYWYCEVCGKYFIDEALTMEVAKEETIIKATGHQIELQNAKEATCTEEGYTGDKVCTVCGEIIEKGIVIPKLAHNFADGQCTVCGYGNELSEASSTGTNDSSQPPDPNSPQTSDSNNAILWIALLFASGAGAAVAAKIGEKRYHTK